VLHGKVTRLALRRPKIYINCCLQDRSGQVESGVVESGCDDSELLSEPGLSRKKVKSLSSSSSSDSEPQITKEEKAAQKKVILDHFSP